MPIKCLLKRQPPFLTPVKKMHELTHLQTNLSVSAVALIALHSRLLHFIPQESGKHQPLS